MTGYWGASADPNYGYSPYSGQLHYGSHPSSSEPFTSPPSEDNPMTIENIQMRIHNMHPERIAALADQWQNAWTVLTNARSYLLQQSTVLHDEHWKSPEARDAFLRKGPGEALAYIDVWMDAVQKNVTALRHLVHVAQDARRDIDELVRRYEAELGEAKNVDFGENLGGWVTGLTVTWSQARDLEISENVNETTKKFKLEAQTLAHRVGDQFFDYTGTVANGVGPPYKPMDAVLNTPGKPPLPNLPNLPPGAAPPPPPGIQPAPPPPGPTDPTHLKNGELVTAPPVPPPGVLPPPLPAPPPGILPPGVGRFAQRAPAPPPGVAPPLPTPPGLPTGLAKTLPGQVPGQPPSTLPPGAGQGTPSGAPPPAPPRGNPGQLGRRSFGERGAQPPGTGQPPGRTLRRTPGRPGATGKPGTNEATQRGANQPGQPGTPPGRGGQKRAGEVGDRQPGTPVGGDEAFARPPTSTAPPVLKNPTKDRNRSRPGSREELGPAAYSGDGDGSQREGTAPPVLNSPARPGPAVPSPGQRRTDAARTRRKQAAEHGSEWIGAQEARADAGASVLDAPVPPPSGSRISRLEEVPKELRSRAATKEPATGRTRPGAVSPELSKRRTDTGKTAAEADDEARGVVTDEQAFEVQTPGGGVVTSKRDEPVYEPEQRRALGGRD